jgi:hypothetical protein
MKIGFYALLIVLLTTGVGFAFGLPSIPGVGDASSASASLEDAVSAQTDLENAYSNGAKFNLQTQGLMAEALGLKDEAAKFLTAADGIQEGNAKSVEATRATTEGLSAVVEQKMAQGEVLSTESKKKVGESLVTMAQSLLSYKIAADKSQSSLEMAKSVIANAPLTQKLSAKNTLNPVLTIAPKVPGDLASVAATAKKYMAFAKSAGIEPPSDLNSALGDL